MKTENIIKTKIQFLKGVGPTRAKQLEKLNIYTVEDLITHFPRNYEDRSRIYKINQMQDKVPCVFIGTTISVVFTKRIRKGLNLHTVPMKDANGACEVTWFNQDYVKDKILPGQTYAVYGVPKIAYGKIQIENPVIVEGANITSISGIIPIYNLTKSITQNYIIKLLNVVDIKNITFQETLNDTFLKKYNLVSLDYAMKKIHFPSTLEEAEKARRRLIFEELFMLQIALYTLKTKNLSEKKGTFFKDKDIQDFLKEIPFTLTNSQLKVVEEMKQDMSSNKNMNRLVQGDVGSGKTIVAAIGLYIAVKNGYQAAMMAPTTILANQHYAELSKIFEKLNMKTEIITSASTKKQKNEICTKLKNGEIDILFGTHAVLEDYVEFKKLGFVVTDEQHRFGVSQRMKLANKGIAVDTLIMTATPIPRTLALMLYGDMDISIIDELPPGRKEIKTYVVGDSLRERINAFCKKEMNNKKQIYVVCPTIEENEDNPLASVEKIANEYMNETFKEFNVAYLHGKMKNKEKDEIMNRFKSGDLDMIISTTVIEVGVNVPNATIMMIEDADRFGLAQLHQLRGRVGRGADQSFCILKTSTKNPTSIERLKVMQSSASGFEVAEKDLQFRGPGEFFGTKQSGLPQFKIADLLRDNRILKETSNAANEILQKDPNLALEENKEIKEYILNKYSDIINNIVT
ncbi:MAG: ATP-dependent DNA helicase RecG [Clostridia bacterium]